MNVHEIYKGSNGDATKALYAHLETLGPAGVVALNLFRAQKCSARAKLYRRSSHKREAYGRKNWSLQNLCTALGQHAGSLGIDWGWKEDPAQEFHCWVLYVVLPTGQASFHSATALSDQRFVGDWDGTHESAARILAYAASLLAPGNEKTERPPGEPIQPASPEERTAARSKSQTTEWRQSEIFELIQAASS